MPSYVLRCLNEWIARRANREDECKGRFWEGRFKCQALLDNAAVLACSAYVDLNPIRAGIAKSLQESEYTSVQDRVCSRQGRGKVKAFRAKMKEEVLTNRQERLYERARQESHRDDWLCPIGRNKGERRGFLLGLKSEEYLELLDWTGRELKAGKPGAIPAEVVPVLLRVDMNVDQWLETMRHYGSWYYRFVGAVEKLVETAGKLGRKWLRGVRPSKKCFSPAEPG